jgi:hypothetical protein
MVEDDLIIKSISFLPHHIKYLNSVDNNNLSNATRSCIDRLINHDKKQIIEKNLLLFAWGCVFVFLTIFVPYLLAKVVMICIGLFYVFYSTVSMIIWRYK